MASSRAKTGSSIGSRARAPGVDHGDRRHRATLELLGQIGTIVIGRGAYEDMVRGWPGSDNPMVVLMNTLPKVVFSQEPLRLELISSNAYADGCVTQVYRPAASSRSPV